MFEKFLAFIGKKTVTLEDGKANFEMTEEQMQASGKVIEERDTALADVSRISAELEEERQQNTTAQAELAKANKTISTLTTEKTELQEQVKALKDSSAAQPGEVVIDTNAVNKKGESPCVTKVDGDIKENIARVKEAYL